MPGLLPGLLSVIAVAGVSRSRPRRFRRHTLDDFAGHPRVIIISDIGNEPDDQMSLVRLLVYSNELDIEALHSHHVDMAKGRQSSRNHARALSRSMGKCGPIFCSTPKAGRKPDISTSRVAPRTTRLWHGRHRTRRQVFRRIEGHHSPPSIMTILVRSGFVSGAEPTR